MVKIRSASAPLMLALMLAVLPVPCMAQDKQQDDTKAYLKQCDAKVRSLQRELEQMTGRMSSLQAEFPKMEKLKRLKKEIDIKERNLRSLQEKADRNQRIIDSKVRQLDSLNKLIDSQSNVKDVFTSDFLSEFSPLFTQSLGELDRGAIADARQKCLGFEDSNEVKAMISRLSSLATVKRDYDAAFPLISRPFSKNEVDSASLLLQKDMELAEGIQKSEIEELISRLNRYEGADAFFRKVIADTYREMTDYLSFDDISGKIMKDAVNFDIHYSDSSVAETFAGIPYMEGVFSEFVKEMDLFPAKTIKKYASDYEVR